MAQKVQEQIDPIVVKGVQKRFRIPHESRLTVYDHLAGSLMGKRRTYEDLWALKDVSFTVKRGETFGVIGANGSGKSTLLKVLAGVLYPDAGSVHIHGRVAPFLELGVGFQPELSAHDNVYLYGAVMGLSKSEISSRYEEIMEFAELKRFENMLLRNFSSGMYVRLAFSTAIQTKPDIMLVDEVLSVGDEAFQRKCASKIEELRRSGTTILLVSHALGTIKQICHRCLLMDKGKTVIIGETSGVVDAYNALINGI